MADVYLRFIHLMKKQNTYNINQLPVAIIIVAIIIISVSSGGGVLF